MEINKEKESNQLIKKKKNITNILYRSTLLKITFYLRFSSKGLVYFVNFHQYKCFKDKIEENVDMTNQQR